MEFLGGLSVLVSIIIFALLIYLFIMAILLPHYVRQIKNEVIKISAHIGASTTTQISNDKYAELRALADRRDRKEITEEQFQAQKAEILKNNN